MKQTKKALAILLAVLMLALSMPFAAFAEESGIYQGFNWTLSDDGMLTITGSGTLEGNADPAAITWNANRAQIKKVILKSGITTIKGSNFFVNCPELATIVLPDSLTYIGANTFKNVTTMPTVIYCGTQEQWETVTNNSTDITAEVLQYHVEHTNTYASNNDGTHTATCSVCGLVETKNCDYNETSHDATCTAGGYTTYTCKACAYTYNGEAGAPNGHDDPLVAVAEDPATCTEPGTAAYWYCNTCKQKFSDEAGTTPIEAPAEIPALGHDFNGEAVKNDDKTHSFKCKNEGCTLVGTGAGENAVVDGKEACTFGDYDPQTDTATCIHAGKISRFCTVCKNEDKKDVNAKGHIYEGDAVNNNDMNAEVNELDGTHSMKCKYYGLPNGCREISVDKVSHNWNDGEVITAPTCTTPGTTRYTCQTPGCGATKDITTPMSGHDFMAYTPVVTTAEDGTVTVYVSSFCKTDGCPMNGEKIEETQTATLVETTVPTCSAKGYGYYEATFTKGFFADTNGVYQFNEGELPVDPDAHQLKQISAVARTCENGGNDAYWKCDLCGAMFADNNGEKGDPITEAPNLGSLGHNFTGEFRSNEDGTHSRKCLNGCGAYGIVDEANKQIKDGSAACRFGDWTDDNADCETAGGQTRTCQDCGYVDSQNTNPLQHNFTGAAVNNEDGTHSFHCVNGNCTAIGAMIDEEPVKKEDGGVINCVATYSDWTADTATCEQGGTHSRTCSVCKYVDEQDTTPLGHDFSGDIVANNDQTHSYKCTREGCNATGAVIDGVVKTTADGGKIACTFAGDWQDDPVNKPTCQTGGIQFKACECGNKITQNVNALGHKFDNARPFGNHAQEELGAGVHVYYCSNGCGEYDVENKESHNWSDWAEVATDPTTCSHKGTESRKCTICELEETKTADDFLPHDYLTPEYSVTTSTAEDGTTVYTVKAITFCNKCSDKQEETVVAEIVVTEGKEPTCSAVGEGTYVAKFTNEVFSDYTVLGEDGQPVKAEIAIDPDAHNLNAVQKLDPTCEADGYEAYWQCTLCSKLFKAETATAADVIEAPIAIDALQHQWSDVTYTWAENNGTVTAERTCTRDNCGKKETETVNVTSSVTKDPTCTVKGETTYTSAAFINPAFTAQVKTLDDIPAQGHTYAEPKDADWTWTKTADGYTATVKVTCIAEDDTQTLTATVALTDSLNVEHLTDGYKTYTATANINDQTFTATKTDTITAEGHTIVAVAAAAATCEKDGNKAYTYCSVCDVILTLDGEDVEAEGYTTTDNADLYTLDALGHDWSEITYTWADDDSEVTAERTCQRGGCDAEETETVAATGQMTQEANCVDAGIMTYTSAAFKNEAFEIQEKDVSLGKDMTKHVGPFYWDDEDYVGPSYTEMGHYDEVYYCSACSNEVSRETYYIDVIPHNHEYTSVVTREPNCTYEGERTFTCQLCGAVKTEGIPTNGKCADPGNDGYCDYCGNMMSGGDHCPQCGKIHNGGFGDKLTGFFHRIAVFFTRLFR